MHNSSIEKKFIELIKNKDLRVVSFDIFETLAYRKVNKPIDIFTLVGQYKYVKNIYDSPTTFQHFRIEAEKKARHVHPEMEDITLELIYNQMPLTQQQQKYIMNLELKEEKKNIYINKQIFSWIKKAIKANKKVILTSDIYLSKTQLIALVVSKLKNPKFISQIYVSSENNATKGTGKLFNIILNDSGILPKELLHIGDNQYSDIQIAQTNGIFALHYNCDEYVKEILAIESNYIKQNFQNSNYRIQACLLNPYNTSDQRFFFNLGAMVFGPVMWEFSNWINQLAVNENIKQINCVMREGRIFSKYISKINKKIDINLLYASRKSTFLSALDIDAFKEKGVDFFQHRLLSIENLYNLFKLDIRHEFIYKHKSLIIKNANLVFSNDESLLDLITKDFLQRGSLVELNANNERRLFKKYLEQLSYTDNSILIDFGATGTILKNISNVLGNEYMQKASILFYTTSAGFEKMLSQRTLTFLPFTQHTKIKIEQLHKSVNFIETLFNGINKTTLHYVETDDKIVKAVTDFPYEEIEKEQIISDAFDRGIDSFFQIVKKYKVTKKLYSRKILLDFITRLIEIPNHLEATYLGNLYHDEGYGSNLVHKLITPNDIKIIKQMGVEKAHYLNTSNNLYNTKPIRWPQGAITQVSIDYLSFINGLKIKSVNETFIDKIIEILKDANSISEVYVYGAGDFFTELRPALINLGIKIQGVIDTKAKFTPFRVNEFLVTSIENSEIVNNATLIVSSAVYSTAITQTIINFARKQDYILNIINFENGLITTQGIK